MNSHETDESLAGRKIPVEKLNKDDLVKKYKQAILIAQKAKESKTELLKHLAQHEELMRTLEERLKKLESEKVLEAEMRAQLENQLKQSKEALQLREKERCTEGGNLKGVEAKDSEIFTKEEADLRGSEEFVASLLMESSGKCCEGHHTENSRLVSELEDSKQKIEALELELSSMKHEVHDINVRKDELDNAVIEKGKEITMLKETMNEEKDVLEKCQSELRLQILTLENSLKQARIAQNEKNIETESKVHSLQELLLAKDEELKRLEVETESMKSHLDSVQSEIIEQQNHLDNKEDVILQLVSQLEEFKAGDQTAKKALEEETVVQFKLKDDEIHQKENIIAQLSLDLQEATDSLNQLSSDLNEKTTLLQSEKECYLQQISSLESEKALLTDKLEEHRRQGDAIPDLKSHLQQIETELLEKNRLVIVSEDARKLLDSQIEELKRMLQDQTHSLQNMSEQKISLEHEILEKSATIHLRDEEIVRLSSELMKLKDDSESQKLIVSQNVSKMDAMKTEHDNYLEDFMNQLANANSELQKRIQENNELQETCSNASQREQELKEQLNLAQESLQKKELILQDLEQEIMKLKDAAANECTNTEVSSTFSLSRAEEQSRMRDLEDSFEDKYTKLRVVAVKLKRRVSELTQTLESERSKSATEKSDLQGKISQLASQAKTVQTLQSEVDRLQDLLEDQKKAQLKLSKDLDSAVREVSASKSELAAYQEELDRLKIEKQSLEAAKSDLEIALSQAKAISSETGRICKDLKEKDTLLETCMEEKKKLTEQLEKAYADAKKKGVLSLEIADMEKSVSESTRLLNIEQDRLKNTENELKQERIAVLTLEEKIRDLENQLSEKEVAVLQLKDLLALAKEECEGYQSRCKEKESSVELLTTQLERERSLVEDLNIQCSDLAAKQVQTKESSRQQIETLSRQVFQLEEQYSSLQDSHKALEDELTSVKADFENYKVRAQSVLRQSAKQEDRMIASSTAHDAEELEVEVERLRVNTSNIKANLKQTTSQLQAAMQEINAEREEKARALKLAQSSKESCAQAIERQHTAEERLSVILEESKQAKLHSDMLVQCYKQQLEDLKTTHQKKIANLTEQIENLQASLNNAILAPAESEQAPRVPSEPSAVSEWRVQSPNPAHADLELSLRLSTLQREEGEGSESVDSFPSRRVSVTTHDRRHELVPLDKLLSSSSSFPEDEDGDVTRDHSSELNINLLQSKLSACELRAAHLTALLSEAESDAARLSQLNAVLKEEIRRQQRSEERTQHAHNLEYLKNIVVKFITLQNGDERQRLLPVLNTILKLSPEEAGMIASVAKGTTQASNSSRSWGNYLHLPGWTDS